MYACLLTFCLLLLQAVHVCCVLLYEAAVTGPLKLVGIIVSVFLVSLLSCGWLAGFAGGSSEKCQRRHATEGQQACRGS